MRMYWSNFVTGEADYREAPTTDEEAKQYIPQWPAALNLYDLRRQMGDSVMDALGGVLESVTGRRTEAAP